MFTFTSNPFSSIDAPVVTAPTLTEAGPLELRKWYLWYQSDDVAPVLVRRLDDLRYVGVIRFAYTWGLVWGYLSDWWGYEDRWCFEHLETAVAAGWAWDGDTVNSEPEGWHRHPSTGRRRPGGDATAEYINM